MKAGWGVQRLARLAGNAHSLAVPQPGLLQLMVAGDTPLAYASHAARGAFDVCGSVCR